MRFWCALLLLLSVPAGAQEVLEVRDWVRREDLGNGFAWGKHSFLADQSSMEIDYFEVRLNAPGISVELAVPPEGPMGAGPVSALAESVTARAAVAWVLPPALDEDAELTGLTMAGGRLFSWPPQGPQVILHHEGTIELRELEHGEAVLAVDGQRVPLVSVNGRLPEAQGEVCLFTGVLSGAQLPAVKWPAELQAVTVAPAAAGVALESILLKDEWKDRRVLLGDLVERPFFRSSSNEGVLIFRPPLDPRVQQALTEGSEATVDVAVEERAALAQAVLPAGEVLMRAGEPTEAGARAGFANAVALDMRRNRLMVLTTGQRTGRRASVPVTGVQKFLKEEGFGELVALPERAPALYVPEHPEHSLTGGTYARMALAVTQKERRLVLPESGELQPVWPGAVEGTRQEPAGNQPRALFDEMAAFTPRLGQFWVSPFVQPPSQMEDTPNRLRFVFREPVRIAAVELVHAEAAGFSPHFNIRSFRLLGRKKREEGWSVLAAVSHDRPVARERVMLAGNPELGEVRLEVVEPSFVTGGDVMRLAEVFFWSAERKK